MRFRPSEGGLRLRFLKSAVAASLALLAALLAPATPAKAAQGTTCMPVTGTISGLTFSTDVTAGLAAVLSSNSGATAPTNDCSGAPVAGQVWLDTSASPYALKQWDGSAWLVLAYLDNVNHQTLPLAGGGVVSVASAATTDICANKSAYQTITGATTIASLGTSCAAGQFRFLQFASTPTLTASSSLILPTGLTAAQAGDQAVAAYLGSGVWRIVSYQRASGLPLVESAPANGITGQLLVFGGTGCPSGGWFVADGTAVSRTTYSALFAVTSTIFGAGDGSTTFNLPDLRGAFVRGVDSGRGLDSGRAFGSFQADAFASHSHGVNDPGHSHQSGVLAAVNAAGFNNSSPFGSLGGTTITTSVSTTGISIAAAGGAETRPKNVALLYCIKN